MKLSDFLFFTDENMDPALVIFLREQGLDVFDTKENNLFASSDAVLLDMEPKIIALLLPYTAILAR